MVSVDEGRIVALDFLLKSRRGMLDELSCDEIDDVESMDPARTLALDFRLKSPRGGLGVSCDDGEGGVDSVDE